jgi:hypothetical protein
MRASLLLCLLMTACTHDFSSFDPAPGEDAAVKVTDAGKDAVDAMADAGHPRPLDAARDVATEREVPDSPDDDAVADGPCTPDPTCLSTAMSCANQCAMQKMQCEMSCMGFHCMHTCDDMANHCDMQCIDTCTSCTQACPGGMACQMAVSQ